MKTTTKIACTLAVLAVALAVINSHWKHATTAAAANKAIDAAASPASAGSSFVPLLAASGLDGWHSQGSGDWQVTNSELTGTPKSNGGGWLVANDGYQDFILHISFQCANCNAGVLLRGGKQGDGMTGIYIPIGGPQMGKMYRASLTGADQSLANMTPMPSPPPPTGFKGAIDEGACAPVSCDGVRDAHGGAEGTAAGLAAPKPIQLRSDWNDIAITMRGDVISAAVNGTALAAAEMDDGPWYGEIALRAAGNTGNAVKFKDVTIKDLTLRGAGEDAAYTSPQFRRQQLTPFFYSEGITAGDIYHHGAMDVVSGPFIYEGPNYNLAREFFPPLTYDVGGPQDGYIDHSATGVPQATAIVHGEYTPVFISWVHDFNNSGWPDIIDILGYGPRPTFSAHIFVNPHGEKRDWQNFQIYPVISNEYDEFLPKGIDGSGTPEMALITATNPDWTDSRVGYIKPGPDVTKQWTFVPVSEPAHWGGHGMGVGDILGNGRLDILTYDGWWEQPPQGTPGLWKFHPQKFGASTATALVPGTAASCFACGGSTIQVYDVNGDGLPDVITALNAHGPGLGWFEQQRDAQGNVTWKEHVIMGDPATPIAERGSWEETDKKVAFTELHAIDFGDMNGDGLLDIVTGKRYWSHGFRYEENDVDDPPVVYWFELKRLSGPGHKVEWIPHMIDNSSGVGTSMMVTDLNGDGKPDVITASRMGTFVFLNKGK
jgi:Domain of Unknown Function (DUF1080)/FG-GAP-like repeat